MLILDLVCFTIGVLIGGMILASANNMLSLYIGIETLSQLRDGNLKRNDELSSGRTKMFSLRWFGAGLMLFGMSHIYCLGWFNFLKLLQS